MNAKLPEIEDARVQSELRKPVEETRKRTGPVQIGVVVIGRNEGARLKRCLASILALGVPIVYADSGSSDGSAAMARSLGVEVVDMGESRPFTAGRGRNEGLSQLVKLFGPVRLVQFVDGDCELAPGWLAAAAGYLSDNVEVAAVAGRLIEKHPDASIYNHLCEREWRRSPGPVRHCGGIFMIRYDAMESTGGFDRTIVAGEEPELCSRLREQGWDLHCIDSLMGVHDSDMVAFSQWWRRDVRGGCGTMDLASRFADAGAKANVRRARIWGLGWPLAVVVGGAIAGLSGGVALGVIVAMILLLALPAQILRLALRFKRDGVPMGDAVWFGALTMVSKWAQLLGQWRYLREGLPSGENRVPERHEDMPLTSKSEDVVA